MPRHVNHESRRALIEEAAIAIATESGFAAVTIRAIAERIGASTSAVTHYVGSREELLRNAIRREVDMRRQEAEAAIGGLEDAAALRAFVEWAVLGQDEPSHQRWLALVLGAASEPMLRIELGLFNLWWSQQMRERIARLGPADPTLAEDLLNVLVDGLIVTSIDMGQPWPAERRLKLLDTVWQALGL